ncbi:MAG: sugar phosphate isomerase/epimerase [Candidatus Firestonebacteria bacterium]|nr:sugar phosphate isomerase/epimerase [Candidatus Firestonebacteria bacterium]
MKLGFFVNAYRLFSIDYALDSVVKHGYQGVELWAKGNHITPFDNEEIWLGIKNKILNLSLEIYGISAHLDFVAPDKNKRELEIKKFLGVIKMAKVMGVNEVHTASGGLYKDISFDLQEKYFLEAMNILGKEAHNKGIIIALEPEPEKWLSKPHQVVDIIENRLSHPVFKVLFDTGHAFGVGTTPEDYLKAVKKHLHLVHLDDVRKADFPHQHLIPGEGDIDYISLFNTLKEIGYNSWISMELNRHNEKPDAAAEKAKRFIDGYRKYWG